MHRYVLENETGIIRYHLCRYVSFGFNGFLIRYVASIPRSLRVGLVYRGIYEYRHAYFERKKGTGKRDSRNGLSFRLGV